MNNGDNTQVIVELLPQVHIVAQQMRKHLPSIFHRKTSNKLAQSG